MLRPSRAPQSPDAQKTVFLRMAIFAAGAVLALIGMATETNWILYIAVGILFVGVVLRLAARRGDAEDPP